MRRLREEVNETVGLHVLDGHDMVCVQYNQASHPLTVQFWLGERTPVHVTATGLVCLANLSDDVWPAVVRASAAAYPSFPVPSDEEMISRIERIRRDQIGVADDSYQKGVRAMATPIRSDRGALVATLSIVAPVSRLTSGELLKHRKRLIDAAASIGRKIPSGMGVLAAKILEPG
jgi:DNA-binding IclR family transcriptional regulator